MKVNCHYLTMRLLHFKTLLKDTMHVWFHIKTPVICIPRPLGAEDTGDIAGLKCRDLTYDVSPQCRGLCQGFNFPLV